eukprot:1160481-Pelagomonas_calceolata.AAC.4
MKAQKRRGASTAGNGKLPETPFREEQQKAEASQFQVASRLSNGGAVCAAAGPQVAREQCVQLDFVRFSTVATASEGFGIMCLAHLHMQEQCSFPAATLLQLYCCRQLVHATVVDKQIITFRADR